MPSQLRAHLLPVTAGADLETSHVEVESVMIYARYGSACVEQIEYVCLRRYDPPGACLRTGFRLYGVYYDDLPEGEDA